MDGQFPMRIVAKRTGLSPHVIRVWERRYGAIKPARSQTNRRLYSEADIVRLSRLARLTQYGHSISQVASLADDELSELAQQVGGPPPAARSIPVGRSEVNYQDFIHEALTRVKALDTRGLEAVLKEAGIRMSQRDLIDGILSPLLEQIGTLWEKGALSPSHEHMASAIIHSFVSNLPEAFTTSETAPRIVIATLAGQRHELGALMAAKTAAAEAWDVTYLGANLPAEDIATVSKQCDAQILALSIIYAEEPEKVLESLRCLKESLSPQIDIIIGGRFTRAHKDELNKVGITSIDTIGRFRDFLIQKNLELTASPS